MVNEVIQHYALKYEGRFNFSEGNHSVIEHEKDKNERNINLVSL